MSRGGRARAWPVALTARGAAQLAAAAALLAAGAAGGWHAVAAAGAALALAGAVGLVGVLLARGLRAGERGPAGPLGAPERSEDSWARVDQHGRVIGRPGRLPAERGLYRQRSVTLTWHDAFGFWRARRVEATDREVRVPPVADPALVRLVSSRAVARSLDRNAEPDPSGVRPYERGDGLRQISWRQTAHHGELMSLETAGGQAPPVLVVADTLGARDADALAVTAEALLRGLRRVPDVLLTDGLASWRSPVQQERFLAALVADDEAAGGADARARLVGRLAGGGAERRRVLLVTCDARGPLATALSRGPLGRALVVVEARPGLAAATPHEGRAQAEKDEAPAAAPPAAAGTTLPCELLALACCCALALLSMVPFLDMIRDGAWAMPTAALLAAGAAAGCGTGSLLARRGARPVTRAIAAEALAVAALAAGVLVACSLFEARRGFGVLEATAELVQAAGAREADPLGAMRSLVASGVAQLGGQPFAEADAAWDLLVLLGGTALAAICALLASFRPTRAAVAIAPLGLAAADQSVMGTTSPAWVAGVCALGLALAWLAAPRDRRPLRVGLVVLLACALGAAGTLTARADGVPAIGLSGGTRIETLVDLSRDLRRNSSAVALTYTTNADRPLYLRAAVLEDFDGSTWRANTDADADALLDEPLQARSGATIAVATATVTTTIRTRGGSSPVPPGTVSVRSTDARAYVATGSYREPVTSVEDVDEIGGFVTALSAAVIASSRPTELLVIGGERGEHVSGVVAQARADGVLDSGDQVAVVRWLVDYFTSGGFVYALDAPGGDGQDNLAVIDDFLAERRGYCTHYATAFTVLARLLGVPARVAMGYQPEGPVSADGSYEVTMRQLHAWSEVWLDGIGWIGVDVTPAAGDAGNDEPEDTTPAAPTTSQRPQAEADAPDEEPEAEADEPGVPSDAAEGEATGDAPLEPPAWLAPALLGLCALGCIGAAAGLALRARRRRLERGDWDYAWRRVCRVARRARVRWERSATEQDVAAAICARLDDAALEGAVRDLARHACLARYGESPVVGDGSRLPQALRDLAHALRSR